MTEPVSEVAFDRLVARLDHIDETGTRGVGVVAVQIQQLAKDITAEGLKIEAHINEHRQAERDRVKGRRWLIGTVIAAVAAVDVPTVFVLVHRR